MRRDRYFAGQWSFRKDTPWIFMNGRGESPKCQLTTVLSNNKCFLSEGRLALYRLNCKTPACPVTGPSGVAGWHPSKHETSTQCWVHVGPPSSTLAQHKPIIGWRSRVCWDIGWHAKTNSSNGLLKNKAVTVVCLMHPQMGYMSIYSTIYHRIYQTI